MEVKNSTYTKLTILINKQLALGRAKTFFKNYPNSELFKQWFIETFFPFIISNEALVINISLNGDCFTIKKDSIEAETQKESFELTLSDDNKYSFILWLIKNNKPMHGDNPIICFARNLRASLSNGHLSYSIDNSEGYTLYLTSIFFDEYVDTKGERIDVSCDDIICIQNKINEILDNKFKKVIEQNRKETQRNLKNFKSRYPSLDLFVNEGRIAEEKNVVKESDIVKSAIKLNWDVNVDNIQYHGIILARKSDIKKELSSPQASGRYESIPFLENSFYCDDAFFIDGDPRHKIGIRIELYSYEDIYQLASDRNSVFFKLLRREFDLECDQI
ncbi:hypothetical protein NXX37_22515 [Parabacteroides distasonis]|nr:hypothetical protein NXX37_22515 [Parabacteroides distasonis]